MGTFHLECISLETGNPIPMPEKTLLCLGNFDGVHFAHRKLLSSAIAWQEQYCPKATVGVFCFRELPARLLDASFQGRLCTTEQRLERFRSCGVKFAVLADFSELRNLSAENYIRDVLVDSCHAVAVACGYNHRFGKGGTGSASLLQEFFGASVFLQEPVKIGEETVSSSRIRCLLQRGFPDEAAQLLTVPYEINAEVLHGKSLGSRMGTPTVNQRFPEDAVIPKYGVYVTECQVDGKIFRGVTNVGVRPTVNDGGGVNFETYLLDFSGDLYGRAVTVRFLKYLREEKRFESQDALWRQINEDIQSARMYR